MKALVACVALLAAACDSESSASDANGTAGGNAGAASGSGANGGDSSGGGGSGGQPGPICEAADASCFPDACEKLCTKFDELGGCGVACELLCPGWVAHTGACSYAMAALLDCIGESTTQCGEWVCQDEVAALDDCSGGDDCFGLSCKGTSRGDVESCTCTTGCSTGALQVSCVTTAQRKNCDCYMGGRLVGTCVDENDFCDVEHSCCAPYFEQS